MAERSIKKKIELHTIDGDFILKEEVEYPNTGCSYFYVHDDTAIILDRDICKKTEECPIFEYSKITSKQNDYVKRYKRVYRFLYEDQHLIDNYLKLEGSEREENYRTKVNDRANLAEVSPLERDFEEHFLKVYGNNSAKYLWKEYGITDLEGKTKYLDYYVKTDDGDIAVEENGVTYHHPQLIETQGYREQLKKQNSCTAAGIKLFRFSSEDCKFEDRLEDDIKSYFGKNTNHFKSCGIVVNREFKLYEHQENTLNEMKKQREEGLNSFLIVFPTASGKSKIVEEDLARFASDRTKFQGLILVPNHAIREDWISRIDHSLKEYENQILVVTYGYIERHYMEYQPSHFDYVVVDEAHHAVAPGLKRVIQYYQPEFLVGLTATDERPDKKRLESVFGNYRVGLSLQEAMEKGIVANANVFRVETNLNLSEVRINGKDYVNADLEKTIRVTSRNQLIVDVIREYFTSGDLNQRQGIIFCVNVNHANEMERCMREAGISASAFSSKSKNPDKIMEKFRNKEIRFLCTCQMISEGWDYPELGIIVMARPTLSKVLYLQQLGRGLRKTKNKKNVFVIDVVDQYGAAITPCSMHSIFQNPFYTPFGDIMKRTYHTGDMIEVDGLVERVERITEIDIHSFDHMYGNYLSKEQVAREFYVSTGTITSWIQKKKIVPTVSFPFGNKKIYMFSPEDVEKIRKDLNLKVHNDDTMRDDFFDFLGERDYSLSYKMPFLLSLIKHMDESGDAKIEDVLLDYIKFYQDRIEAGLVVDRKTCPYTEEVLKNRTYVKRSMLTNPFEKFERKRFLYYSKDLSLISMNHALHRTLDEEDYQKVVQQMKEDLKEYYSKLE